MKFSQRLAYYLLGLMIGLFGVFYFLDAKDTQFCYLPNCRVLKDIRNKPYAIAQEAQDIYQTLSKEEIQAFLTYGDIDFSKSNIPVQGGKLYIIQGKNKEGKKMIFEIINYSDRFLLKKIQWVE